LNERNSGTGGIDVRGTSETIEMEGSGGIEREGEEVGRSSDEGGDERGEGEWVDGAGGGSDGVGGSASLSTDVIVGSTAEDDGVGEARLDEIPSVAVSTSLLTSVVD
jgi:hypothetical protein